MKRVLIITIVLFFSAQVFTASAQTVTLLIGNLDFLKDQTSIHTIYDYDGMRVRSMMEDAYIKKQLAAYSTTPALGEEWLKEWNTNRVQLFEPAFEKSLNKETSPTSFNHADSNTAYTLIIRTTFIEPGYSVLGSIRQKAQINVTYTFINTKTHRIAAQLFCDRILAPFDFHTKTKRLIIVYEKAGRLLGEFLQAKGGKHKA